MIATALRVIQLVLIAGFGGLIAYRATDRDLPSKIIPLETVVYQAPDGGIFIRYFASVERFRECPFRVDREAWIGSHRVILPSSIRGRQPIEKIESTGPGAFHVSKADAQSGADLMVKIRVSYSCNPLQYIWPIIRDVEFERVKVP